MTGKAVLIVGAGQLQVPMITAAHDVGLYAIATDGNPSAPGLAIADEGYSLDTADVAGHVALAQRLRDGLPYDLCGVVTCGADVAPTVAHAAQAAGVQGITPQIATMTHNKARVRAALDAAGWSNYQPRWDIWYYDDPLDFVASCTPFPCVVKPLCQRASRGVSLVSTPLRLAEAIALAAVYAGGSTQYIIEELLVGTEHSAEVLFDGTGTCVHFHACDRFFDYRSGIPLELGHRNPSTLSGKQQALLKSILLVTADALGIQFGCWKHDFVWTATGPKILEVTARCSGGWDSQWTYPQSTGDDLLRRILQVYCGLPIDPQPQIVPTTQYAAVAGIYPRKAGHLTHFPDLGHEVFWHVAPGEEVGLAQHCAQRLGFVPVMDEDATQCWERASSLAQLAAYDVAEATDEV